MTDTWPRIGMPVQLDPNEEKQYLSRCYSDAVASAEGIPILLPLIAAPEAVRPLVETLDGILLTGSNSDVDPSLYGAVRLDACGPAQPLRDRMDSFLLDAAVKHRIPVLAICYGIQSLNVCLGGSLIQDIASAVGTSIRHSGAGLGDTPRHPVRIEPGSLLESAAGRREAWVNSTHHQAIDRLGRGLEVIARAPDGVVEAVAATDPGHWILGVQWHPEKSFADDAFSRNIFAAFLAECRALRGVDARSDT